MTTAVPELVFDEELNAYRLKTTPLPTQRKPETGERLDGTPKPLATGKCYLCRRYDARVFGDIPKCYVCHDRFRRRE